MFYKRYQCGACKFRWSVDPSGIETQSCINSYENLRYKIKIRLTCDIPKEILEFLLSNYTNIENKIIVGVNMGAV